MPLQSDRNKSDEDDREARESVAVIMVHLKYISDAVDRQDKKIDTLIATQSNLEKNGCAKRMSNERAIARHLKEHEHDDYRTGESVIKSQWGVRPSIGGAVGGSIIIAVVLAFKFFFP